jgi:hypothetical protein
MRRKSGPACRHRRASKKGEDDLTELVESMTLKPVSGGKYKMLFGSTVGIIASLNSSITDFDYSLMRILIPEQRC